MQVDTNVAEGDVGRLQAGMAARFHRRRVPGAALQGHDAADPQRAADACRTSSPTTPSSTSTTPTCSLAPGMTANVTFIYDERDDVARRAQRRAALSSARAPAAASTPPHARCRAAPRPTDEQARRVWVRARRRSATAGRAAKTGTSATARQTEVVERRRCRTGDDGRRSTATTDSRSAPSPPTPAPAGTMRMRRCAPLRLTLVIELVQHHARSTRTGDVEVRALAACRSRIERGRVRRDHGRVGLGQVDADEHPRLPRPADARALPARRAATSRA